MTDQYSDSALMSTNGLLYKMPQPLSVCVNRTFKKEYAQRQEYTAGSTIAFDVNSGSSYVDPASCMLILKVIFVCETNGANDANEVSFGTGTAANLISEIRLLSKNGCEVDRTQSADVIAKIMTDYMVSTDGLGMLKNAGYGRTFDSYGGRVHTFAIPLSLISGFFRPTVKGMKIPAGLMAGMRIEFILNANPKRALTITAGPGTDISYVILSPELLFSCMDLNDPTQAVLMRNSAETGLEYTYPSYFPSPFGGRQSQFNEQVKKSVSQCTRVFCTVYDTSGPNNVMDESKDGYKSINAVHLRNYQIRCGSNYYPTKAVDSIAEALYIAYSTFDKSRDLMTNPCRVRYEEYDVGGKFLIGHPLETDDRLNLSGIPLNNSSVLELRADFANPNNEFRSCELIIEFISVARTFLNKTTLKI